MLLQRSDLLRLQLDEAPRENTQDTELVDCFLEDVNTWIAIRRRLYNQVEGARALCQKYQRYRYDDPAFSSLTRTIDEFATCVNARIDKFDNNSSTLIQLVNVASCTERSKGLIKRGRTADIFSSNSISQLSVRQKIFTKINRSMKRLTWITV